MNIPHVLDTLAVSHGRRLRLLRAERVVRLGWAALAMAAAMVAVDLTVQLSTAWLILADAIALVVLAGLAATVVLSARTRRFNPQAEAVRVERACPQVPNNALINALQFSEMLATAAGPASAALMRQEIASGESAASRVDPAAGLSSRPLRRHLRFLAMAMAAWALAAAMFSDALSIVAVRLLDPTGDHPPFSLTHFEVTMEPADGRVLYDRPLRISARLSGKLPDAPVRLVVEAAGQPTLSLPMFQVAPDLWQQRVEAVRSDLLIHVATAGGRSHRYRVRMVPTPQIEQAELIYTPPAYTGRPPVRQPIGDAGRFAELADGQIELCIRSNRPLGGGAVRLRPSGTSGSADGPATAGGEATQIALTPQDDPHWVSARWTLDQDAQAVARLIDCDGTGSQQELTLYLTALADQRPEVRIDVQRDGRSMPTAAVTLTPPDAKIDCTITASDDIGVAEIALSRTINGWLTQPRTLDAAPPAGRQRVASHRLDLARLGVTPGDQVEIQAEAIDNHPGLPNRGQSDRLVFRVVSQSQLEEMLRQQVTAEQLRQTYAAALAEARDVAARLAELEKQIAQLRDQLKDVQPGQPLSPEQQAALDHLRQKLAEHLQATAKAAELLRQISQSAPLYDVQDPLNRKLADLAKRLERLTSQQRRRMLEDLAKRSPEQLPAALDALRVQFADDLAEMGFAEEQEIRPIERTTQLTADAFKLLAAAQQFVELTRRQQELTRQLSRWANKEELSEAEQMQADKLVAEQAAIRDALVKLTDVLDQTGRQVQGDFPKMGGSAVELARRIRELDIAGDMASAGKLLGIGAGRYGSSMATRALEKMKSLLDDAMPMAGGGPAEADQAIRLVAGGQMNLGQTLQQLLDAAAGATQAGAGQGGGYAASWLDMNVWLPPPPSPPSGDPGERTQHGRNNPSGVARTRDRKIDNVELIRGQSADSASAGGVSGQSTPVQFRPLVEAYLTRLADESR